MKVYFNPKCSKCRLAGDYLQKHKIKFEKFEYLKKPFTKKEIKEILEKGDLKINQIIRIKEPEYKELIKGKNLTDDKIIDIIIKHPVLLQRPIIVSNDKVIIARNEESLHKI